MRLGKLAAQGGSATAPLSALTVTQLQAMHWNASSRDPAGNRDDASVAWTGHELIVAGRTRIDGTATKTIEAYDPATNHWRRLDEFPLAARGGQLTAWTGHDLFVWSGGCTRTTKAPHLSTDCGILQDGALPDPVTGHWRVVSAAPAGTEAPATAAVDPYGDVVVLGGSIVNGTSDAISRRAASYDPAAGRWRRRYW
jgi:N-acetylneuraminic acid mutarotase